VAGDAKPSEQGAAAKAAAASRKMSALRRPGHTLSINKESASSICMRLAGLQGGAFCVTVRAMSRALGWVIPASRMAVKMLSHSVSVGG